MNRFLVVGIGNVGREYEGTRHNVGFMFVDFLSSFFGVGSFVDSKHFSSVVEMRSGENLILLVKPKTFVNLTGRAVIGWKSFYKLENDQIFVVYDDASMDLGRVKIVRGGGSGGHNGVKSVTNCIGEDYFRIKFGIKKDYVGSLESFVLGKMNSEEVSVLEKNYDVLARNINTLLNRDQKSFSMILNQVAQE